MNLSRSVGWILHPRHPRHPRHPSPITQHSRVRLGRGERRVRRRSARHARVGGQGGCLERDRARRQELALRVEGLHACPRQRAVPAGSCAPIPAGAAPKRQSCARRLCTPVNAAGHPSTTHHWLSCKNPIWNCDGEQPVPSSEATKDSDVKHTLGVLARLCAPHQPPTPPANPRSSRQ